MKRKEREGGFELKRDSKSGAFHVVGLSEVVVVVGVEGEEKMRLVVGR